MQRPYNFSPGPAALPDEVLSLAAADMLDWQGSGMSVMEMSHRGREFNSICLQAEADLRELLAIPSEFRVLFMQGGGLAENAIVPMNLSRGGVADFVVTGSWSQKSQKEAQRYCLARTIASNTPSGHTVIPDPGSWKLSANAAYVHLCSNETIHGVEFHELPDLAALGSTAPLVIDCSSQIASRPVDWSRVGLAFAGAQKNIGPAGLTIVIVREDLLGHALPVCPSAFDYKTVADNASMYNTPPTYAIYIAGLVFQWLKAQTHGDARGVAAMEARNIEKAALLYDFIDSSEFYRNPVAPAARSRMNVPFFLRDDALNDEFVNGARAANLLQLRGHKLVGGMRASLYNAMPLAGVQALVGYMREFATRHG
jgi:phosphoserine aminotransferase